MSLLKTSSFYWASKFHRLLVHIGKYTYILILVAISTHSVHAFNNHAKLTCVNNYAYTCTWNILHHD